MHLINTTIGLILLCASFVCHATEKEALSYEILKPIIELMRTGEIYKSTLPIYNEYRKKKGKSALTFLELKPLFDKTAEVSEKAYLKSFAEEFSLDELLFLRDLFSTDVGREIFSKLTKSITTGVPQKPELDQFSKKQKAIFNALASEDLALSQGFAERVGNVNFVVQKYVAEEFKKYPELKALINQ